MSSSGSLLTYNINSIFYKISKLHYEHVFYYCFLFMENNESKKDFERIFDCLYFMKPNMVFESDFSLIEVAFRNENTDYLEVIMNHCHIFDIKQILENKTLNNTTIEHIKVFNDSVNYLIYANEFLEFSKNNIFIDLKIDSLLLKYIIAIGILAPNWKIQHLFNRINFYIFY